MKADERRRIRDLEQEVVELHEAMDMAVGMIKQQHEEIEGLRRAERTWKAVSMVDWRQAPFVKSIGVPQSDFEI